MDGWFADASATDRAAMAAAIREGQADSPDAWPQQAIETGFAADADAYYDQLHAATLAAARSAIDDAERAGDRQLVHTVRAMDDCGAAANDLADRIAEWAGSLGIEASGLDAARAVSAGTEGTPDVSIPDELASLADRALDLDAEQAALRRVIERDAPAVAPNLSALAGPVLAARLIALAGDLESLARMPSGTVQVLGAEEALFAHLRDGAPPPKHGVIYTHPAVRGTRQDDRGSAARAVAGKLTIAARVDHYGGDRRPDLEQDLVDRIDRIRARASDDPSTASAEAQPAAPDDGDAVVEGDG